MSKCDSCGRSDVRERQLEVQVYNMTQALNSLIECMKNKIAAGSLELAKSKMWRMDGEIESAFLRLDEKFKSMETQMTGYVTAINSRNSHLKRDNDIATLFKELSGLPRDAVTNGGFLDIPGKAQEYQWMPKEPIKWDFIKEKFYKYIDDHK